MRNTPFLPSRVTCQLPRAVPSHQLIPVGFLSVGNINFLASRVTRQLLWAPPPINYFGRMPPVIPPFRFSVSRLSPLPAIIPATRGTLPCFPLYRHAYIVDVARK